MRGKKLLKSLRSKNVIILFHLCVSIDDLLLEPNFVEIRLPESGFFFSLSPCIAQSRRRKISKMAAILKWYTSFKFCFADTHNLTYSMNGAIFI